MRDEDDPFYRYDDFGNPLDADTIARRQVLKELRRMSAAELLAHFVRLGIYNPDGTLVEPYYYSDEPSKYRPTD